MSFKKEKLLSISVAGQGVLPYYNKTLSIVQVGGDDTIIIFGIDRLEVFGESIKPT
jgi:hypothetical protein